MDEIKQRLSDASEACIKTYQAWCAKTTDTAAREALQEAVHELRKVAARLEIELAVSDRKAQGADPIPIPSHRASRRVPGSDHDVPDDDFNRGNRQSHGGNHQNQGGHGGQQGGQRRPVQIRRPSEGSAPANEAAAQAPVQTAAQATAQAADAQPATGAEEEGAAPRRTRPLSLKRGGNEPEAGSQ